MYSIKKIIKGLINIHDSFFCILQGLYLDPDISKIPIENNIECVILGNGPSLKETLSEKFDFLKGKKIFCVNDFAQSCFFEEVKPDYCAFFDQVYWTKTVSARNKESNIKNFNLIKEKVKWEMIIFMPLIARKWNFFIDLPKLNKNIKICYINNANFFCIYSNPWKYFFYKKNLAMPIPQNVLIAAIFISLNMKFQKIYLIGAEHSWHKSISYVDKNNILYWENPHLFDKDNVRLEPIFKNAEDTETFRMHEILAALSRVFEGYIELEKYSEYLGAKIYNGSKESYIDAFERYDI